MFDIRGLRVNAWKLGRERTKNVSFTLVSSKRSKNEKRTKSHGNAWYAGYINVVGIIPRFTTSEVSLLGFCFCAVHYFVKLFSLILDQMLNKFKLEAFTKCSWFKGKYTRFF